MIQTLFYIPASIGGYPVFGWGLLLLVWCLLGVGLLGFLAWRQGLNADTFSYLPILAIVAAAIVWMLPVVCDKQGRGLPIRGYGVMMLLAVVAGTGLAVWRGKKRGLVPDTIFSMALWMFLPGIIGGRLFYIIEYWENYRQATFAGTLLAAVNIAEGGLVVYGALIGATLGLLLFVRRNRLPLLAVCDLVAPSIVLGLAIGRLGCFLSGCCYGSVCDLPWAVTFPVTSAAYETQMSRGQMYGLVIGSRLETPPVVLAVKPDSPAAKAGLEKGDRVAEVNRVAIDSNGMLQAVFANSQAAKFPIILGMADGREVRLPSITLPVRSLAVHPTQLYSAVNAFLLCFFLLAVEPFSRREGMIFALMLTIYPIARFLLEIIRTDESAVFGTGLSISQNVSLLLLAAIAVLWYFVLRQTRRAYRCSHPIA